MWLYEKIAPLDGSGLTFEKIRFEQVPIDLLEFIMPILIQMHSEVDEDEDLNVALRGEEKKVVKEITKQQFVDKMANSDLIAVFNKAPLLKKITEMQ